MARTINRTPYTVDEPDISYKFFNHNNWKGVCDDKNFLGVDQESFADAKNVYIDAEGVLKTRPSIINYTDENFDNCIVHSVESFENTLVIKYHSASRSNTLYRFITYDKDGNKHVRNEYADTLSKILLFDNKLFIFNGNGGYYDVNLKYHNIPQYAYYDLITYEYGNAEDLIYVPIIAEYGADENVKTVSESKNILTESYKERYIYTSAGMPTEALDKSLTYDISFNDNAKTVKIPSYNSSYEKYLYFGLSAKPGLAYSYTAGSSSHRWTWSVSKAPMAYANGLWIIYNTQTHTATSINDFSYSKVISILYSTNGKTYKNVPSFPSGYVCVYAMPELSKDGTTLYAVLSKGIGTTNTVYLYKWMPYGNAPEEWTLCGVMTDDDLYTADGISLNAYSDIRCVVSFNSTGIRHGAYYYNGTVLQFIRLTQGSQTDAYIPYIVDTRAFISNRFIYFVSFALKNPNGTDYSAPQIRIDTYFISNQSFFTTVYLANLATDSSGYCFQSINGIIPQLTVESSTAETFVLPFMSKLVDIDTVYLAKIAISGITLTTTGDIVNMSFVYPDDAPIILQVCKDVVYAYRGRYLDTIYNTFSKASPKFIMSTDKVSSNQNVIGLPAFSEEYVGGYVTGTAYNYAISVKYANEKIPFYYFYDAGNVNLVLPDFISTLNRNIIAIDNKTYIDEPRESDDLSKKLLYFPEALLKRYDYAINALHPISTSQMGVFFDDSVWIIQRSENKLTDTIHPDYLYTKSRVQVGTAYGSDVITSYDGKNVIFATKRGLVAMSYQDFIASTDQSLTYLSDSIFVPFVNYCKDNAIKIYQFRYWLIIYATHKDDMYVLDMRNGSWWPMHYDNGFVSACTYNNKPILCTGRLFVFDTTDESCKDENEAGDKMLIEWKVASQKLHFNAPNYYKHLYSLTINAVNDSQRPIAYLLGTTNYRNIANINSDEVMNYQVDVIRSYVKRMNYSKVNEFQYELRNSKSTPSRLSISNITLKYTITSLVR